MYRCCNVYQKGIKRFNEDKKSTGFTDSGFGRNNYLDRHQINCGRNGFIRNFHAVTKAKNQSGFNPYLKFKYSCLNPVVQKVVTKKAKKTVKQSTNAQANSNAETVKKLMLLTNTNKSIFSKR